MKLTTTNLNQLIREEITKNLQEGFFDKFKSKKKVEGPSKPHPKGDVFFDVFGAIIVALDQHYSKPDAEFPTGLRDKLEAMLSDDKIFGQNVWAQHTSAGDVAHRLVASRIFEILADPNRPDAEKTLEKTTGRFKNFLAQNSKYQDLGMLEAVLQGDEAEHKGIAQQARNVRKQDPGRVGGAKPSEMPTMDIHPKK